MRLTHFHIDHPIFAAFMFVMIVLISVVSIPAFAGDRVPGDCAVADPNHRGLSGSVGRGSFRPGHHSARAGDQRRRQHALPYK